MNNQVTEFRNREGDILVWVFPSPGRIWKDRWVAFANCNEFDYFKGTRDQVFKWADDYISKFDPTEESV